MVYGIPDFKMEKNLIAAALSRWKLKAYHSIAMSTSE